jgi:hypothetical protein
MTGNVLTEEELATAWFACAHASSFWRTRGAGQFAKAEAARYDELGNKLGRLLDKATAHVDAGEEQGFCGNPQKERKSSNSSPVDEAGKQG